MKSDASQGALRYSDGMTTEHSSTTQSPKPDKRSKIRRAAYKCFSETGYYNTSVDAICQKAGISKGTFYWYFKEKQEVFLNILDSWGDDVEQALKRAFKTSTTGPDMFASMTCALEEEGRRSRRMLPVWLEFLTHVVREPAVREGMVVFHRRIREFIATLLDPYFAHGFSTKDRQAVASAVVATFLGMMIQDLVDPKGHAFQDNMHRTMAFIKASLATNLQ